MYFQVHRLNLWSKISSRFYSRRDESVSARTIYIFCIFTRILNRTRRDKSQLEVSRYPADKLALRVTVSTVRRQRHAQTTEEMRDLEVGDGERCSCTCRWWSAVKWKVCWRARSPLGTSLAAGSDPTRPPSPERCGCASAFQHQHVCQHQLSIPPLLTHHVSTFLFFDHLVVLSHLWNVQLAPARKHKCSFNFL